MFGNRWSRARRSGHALARVDGRDLRRTPTLPERLVVRSSPSCGLGPCDSFADACASTSEQFGRHLFDVGDDAGFKQRVLLRRGQRSKLFCCPNRIAFHGDTVMILGSRSSQAADLRPKYTGTRRPSSSNTATSSSRAPKPSRYWRRVDTRTSSECSSFEIAP